MNDLIIVSECCSSDIVVYECPECHCDWPDDIPQCQCGLTWNKIENRMRKAHTTFNGE